jgi:hypothetical protein
MAELATSADLARDGIKVAPSPSAEADLYTCPMHPQVVKNAPGKCPICGMNLVKKTSAVPEGASHG